MPNAAAAAAAAPDALRRARLATALVFFLNGVGVASWVVRIPDVQRALGLSEGRLGGVLLGAAVGALFAAEFAPRRLREGRWENGETVWYAVKAWRSLVNRSLNMFTLIATGVGAAYLYSAIAVVAPGIFPESFRESGEVGLYFEAAAVITVLVLLGQLLEAKARSQTSQAIKTLLGA